jgi:hypothetical protein
MAWYEQPYKKGKPAPVPGFPRPLYPPDAAPGHTPSVNGPDVEAYKRVVSRAGRWPWQEFDEAYSNNFAHGSSGNVGETGVAGVQRQQGTKASGWIGKATFNDLRAIIIPDGLPHAGERAMDVTAQNLVAEAWTMFAGQPTPPPATTAIRERALEGAIRHIGEHESPAGSNSTSFGRWYGVNFQPWCAIFVTYCFEIEAGGSGSFDRGSNYAYCPYVVGDARNKRNGLSVSGSPIPGDLVVFDWNRDGTYDHIGIFEKWITKGESFSAVEGNTSNASYSNGGTVMRTTRYPARQGTTFVRVAES